MNIETSFCLSNKCAEHYWFGIIKEVMGFRRFLLRGLAAVKGEWRLVCLAFNLKRLCVLNQGVIAS